MRNRDAHGLWVLGSVAIAVGITEATLWFIRRWLVSRATMAVETDIRNDLYARLHRITSYNVCYTKLLREMIR